MSIIELFFICAFSLYEIRRKYKREQTIVSISFEFMDNLIIEIEIEIEIYIFVTFVCGPVTQEISQRDNLKSH